MKLRGAAFMSGCAMIGLVLASPAFAQQVQAATASDVAPDQGEIIVTAQRRSERLVDVPITITALSADRLARAGITNTLELAQVTPGLELPMFGAFTQPAIRGISSQGSGLGDSSNVATYIDGVYQPSQLAQLADLPNVQDIQVLKGPQGTLYGQNATGGAIIVNTIQPSFTTKGAATVSYGNYDDKVARGYVTGGLSSTVAAMVSGAWEDRGGFNRDLLRGGHDKGLRSHQVRGKLLWTPDNGDTSVTLAGYYTRRNDSSPYAGQPYKDVSVGVPASQFYGLPVPTKPHQFAHNIEPDVRIRSYGASLLGKVPVADVGTLNTVTAYGNVLASSRQDNDVTGVNIAALTDLVVWQHDFIQEVNFTSKKFSGFSFAAGVFYMHNTEKYDPYFFKIYGGTPFPDQPAPVFTIGNNVQSVRNYYAAYLEAGYDLTDTLSVTLGGRYSSEDQRVYGGAYPDTRKYLDQRGTFTFSKFTPRAVVRFKPAREATLYASYTQGFKSGFVDPIQVYPCYDAALGHSTQCVPPSAPVKPEVLTAYEVGFKGRIARILTLSASAFRYDYKDIQVYIWQPGAGRYVNGAKARINGFEFDGSLQVSPELNIGIGGVYLDSKYLDFPNAQVYYPYGTVVNGAPLTCANSGPGGNCDLSVDVGGNRMMRAPKFSLTSDVSYRHSTGRGAFGGSVNVKYSSGFSFDVGDTIRQGRYALINAQVFAEPATLQGVKISVYGKNLTKRDYLGSILQSAFTTISSYGAPRQYGVQADFSF